MERFFQPARLEADPTTSGAEETFLHWLKTFENFTSKINADAGDKLNLLTNYVAPHVYKHISGSASYDLALASLQSLYVKPVNEIYARHVLATRSQKEGETLAEYLQVLKQLSKNCKCKDVTAEVHANMLIRDAFINGVKSREIRQRLLEHSTLELTEAFDKARALEAASEQSASYRNNTEMVYAAAVNPESKFSVEPSPGDNNLEDTVAAMNSSTISKKCSFCGYQAHRRQECPARESECHSCGKMGHYAKVCRVAKKGQLRGNSNQVAAIRGPLFAACSDEMSNTKRSFIQISIGGKSFEALVDTGSTENFISVAAVQKANLKYEATPWRSVQMAASSLTSKIRGQCEVELQYEQKLYSNTKLNVLKDLVADVILGTEFMEQHESVHFQFNGPKPPLILCSLEAMKVDPVSLFDGIDPSVKPIQMKSRNYSQDDQKFIREEIDK